MALTQVDQGLLSSTAQYTGFKNRILNGAMVIDQRNAVAGVTYDGSSGYSLDRYFSSEIGNGAFTVQQVSDAPAGFTKSLKVTVTTAQTGTLNAATLQAIEGFNIADFAWGTASAKTITLSFWVKSSVTGTLGGAIQNSASNRSYPFTYTINSANTWEQKSITIAGDTSGTWSTDTSAGLWLRFTHGTSTTGTADAWAGADYRGPTGATWVIQTLNATWQVTGVQLEKGSTATSFDYRPYTTELQLCQRYYLKSFEPTVVPANGNVGGGVYTTAIAYATTAAYVSGVYTFPVQMRAIPTLAFYGIQGAINLWDIYKSGAWAASTLTAVNQPSSTNLSVSVNSTGLTTFSGNLIAGNFTATAEL